MENELLKIDKLQNSDQWSTWKFQVKIILNASDVFEVVNGESEMPNSSDDQKKEDFEKSLRLWHAKDRKAQKIIATTVGQQPLLHIMNCNTSHEMWTKLAAVYEQKSKTSIHLLQQRFYNFSKDPNDDIATHIAKLETLVQQLKEVGEIVSPTMMMTKILMTLPSSFDHFFSAWESTAADQQTIENLTSRLIMEEARMSSSRSVQSQNAFVVQNQNKGKSRKSRRGKCFSCGNLGHWKSDCPNKNSGKMQARSSWVNKKGNALMCDTVTATDSINNCEWVLDSGASHHMSFRRDWFVNFSELREPVPVVIGNGSTIYAQGKGDINILAFNKRNWVEMHLADVYFVPDIKINLFSSGSTLDKNYELVSNSEKCEIRKNGRTIAVGARENRLYKMMFEVLLPEDESVSANVAEKRETVETWHQRLGHLNINQVRKVLIDREISFVDNRNFFCDACALGKQHRLTFSNSQSRAKSIGDLVHTDVCGPMQEPSIGGSKYFIIFKDDLSHFRNVYFMKSKNEVPDIITKYLNSVKMDTGRNIKVLRSDNGLEYVNNDVKSLLESLGIRHQTSAPYTPQQNGRAERENRTIVELARTMLHGNGLPIKLWAEAVNTAVYLLNRYGPSTIHNKSPYELWFGEKPDIGSLKIFGSSVFVHIPSQKRRKWDRKASPGIFVGYAENTKGFRIWIPNTRKVEISRDVLFKEACVKQPNGESAVEWGTNNGDFLKPNNPEVDITTVVHSTEESDNDINNDDADEVDIEDQEEYGTAEDESSLESVRQERAELEAMEEDNIRNRLRSRKQMSSISNAISVIPEGYAFIAGCYEPKNFDEAMKSEEADRWKEAMKEEINALEKNHAWDLVKAPKDRKIISSKWIYKVKLSDNNQADRYKARLVARGFSQEEGLDYNEIFSPVVKFTSIRIFLTIAAVENLHMKQFDIKTAFLNGELDEEIFISQPKGFEDSSGRVCKLRKSLYGLKQSPRCWNRRFTKLLKNFSFTPTESDPCVFVLNKIGRKIMMAIYVDDGLIAATKKEDVDAVLQYLQKYLDVKVSNVGSFLGLNIRQLTNGSIHVNQSSYVGRVLKRFNMLDCNSVSTPMDVSMKAVEKETSKTTSFPYREAVGSLMYLTIATRPDIAFAVNVACRHLENPSQVHVNIVKRILRYLKGTTTMGIYFDRNSKLFLNCYSDADFAGDVATRRSTSGTCFY